MRPLTRDAATAAGLAAAVLVSLAIVRGAASEPAPTPARTTTGAASQDPAPWTAVAASPLNTSSPAASMTAARPGSTAATASKPPLVTLVLSSGALVNPLLDGTARTPRPASSPPKVVAPTSPPDGPDADVFRDPAAVARAWLAALCWYDYRAGRVDNTRRAAAYGNIQMPPERDPWTLDDLAWAQITAARASSACTGITATVETVSHNGTDETTATLTGTQVLSTAGTGYQAVPIDLTRVLQRDPTGHWRIGRPVTAN